MALYKITVKHTGVLRGIRIEKGMCVDVPCAHDPIAVNGGQVASDAFLRVYGIDLKKLGAANRSYLNLVKVN